MLSGFDEFQRDIGVESSLAQQAAEEVFRHIVGTGRGCQKAAPRENFHRFPVDLAIASVSSVHRFRTLGKCRGVQNDQVEQTLFLRVELIEKIENIGTGKSHPVTATYSDGSTQLVGTVQDGADGQGTGDMSKATYDPNNHGYVDAAAGVTDGTNTLTYATLNGKADAATTLAGYGITDAYTKTEADNKFMDLPASSVTSGKVATSDGSGGFTWATPASGVTTYAALTDTDVSGATTGSYSKYNSTSGKWEVDNDLKSKVANLDTNGKLPASKVDGLGDGVLNIMRNGVNCFYPGNSFSANATTGGTANIETDQFIATSSVVNGTITFTGIDDAYYTTYIGVHAYDVYVDVTSSSTNKSPYAKLTGISGEGTSSMTLTYETDADNGTNTVKLRLIK